MPAQKFKVGDKVQSAEGSSDIEVMGGLWVAEVVEVKSGNDSGGCFITRGSWSPILDDAGNAAPFWANHDPTPSVTERQLWGEHLALTLG